MIFGYQAVYDSDFFDAIRYAANQQFDYVSFDLNVPRFYIDQMERSELEKIRNFAEQNGVGIAFHAPGDNISQFSDYPSIRKGILDHFSSIIAAAELLNARHVTVHTGIHPSAKQAGKTEEDFIKEYQDYFSRILYENLLYLADQTKNVMLCVENYYFISITRKVVERLLNDNNRIFLTWDIAKTYNREIIIDPLVEEFMWKHCDQIREIHAHDIIKGFRSHQIIGEGSLDFTRYAALFQHPEAAVTFEVRPREAAVISRDRLKSII